MPIGDAARDYAEWKVEVAKVRYLPEYRLRKLWRLGFSSQDIAADKHYAVFPARTPARKQEARIQGKRGRALGRRAVDLCLAESVLVECVRILHYHRLEAAELTYVRGVVAEMQKQIDGLKVPGGGASLSPGQV